MDPCPDNKALKMGLHTVLFSPHLVIKRYNLFVVVVVVVVMATHADCHGNMLQVFTHQ